MAEFHKAVLLKETMDLLAPSPGEIYVDGTLGGGGHAAAIAAAIGKNGTVTGIDLDPNALQEAKQKFDREKILAKTFFFRGSYADIDQFLEQAGQATADMILVDLGISSFDLNSSGRGFTFQKDEPLDMRFDPEGGKHGRRHGPLHAAAILQEYEEAQLEKIFRDYGEEKFSRKIARAILAVRSERPLKTTTDLFELIKKALPAPLRHKAADSARRIFQALRIEVNGELENLQRFLPKAFQALGPAGRLAIISFHSLEDRLVKHFFLELAKGCICPPDFPECRCGKNPQAKILTRKPITASLAEQQDNSRSKPAKLRGIQKI